MARRARKQRVATNSNKYAIPKNWGWVYGRGHYLPPLPKSTRYSTIPIDQCLYCSLSCEPHEMRCYRCKQAEFDQITAGYLNLTNDINELISSDEMKEFESEIDSLLD